MTRNVINSNCIVLNAFDDPIAGLKVVGTHQRYRDPQLTLKPRTLGDLHSDHVRLRMRYVGICGTDVHLVTAHEETGYVQSSAPALIPQHGRVIGHEGVGEIIGVGADVKHLRIGMMVAPESIISCSHCSSCRRGMFNQCQNAKLVGMEVDGLFAEICDVPARIAQPIGLLSETDAGMHAAALLEPAGVAYLACENSKISAGDSILIIGAGPIGLLCAILAKEIFGAAHVTIVEQSNFRRSFAKKWCDAVFAPNEIHGTDTSFHALIEASGALSDAMGLVRRVKANGAICLLARSGRPLYVEAVDHIISNNISIVGCRGHLGGIFERLMKLVLSNRLPLHRIVTGMLSDLNALRDVLKDPSSIVTSHCKVLCKIS